MRTVMLVDDNLINNFVNKQVIQNTDSSLQIKDYTDSEAALTVLQQVDPTFIFLDLNMPVLSGWQFLDEMASRHLNHKVFILTSSSSDLDRQRSENYPNVVSYITKPLSREKLAAALQVA